MTPFLKMHGLGNDFAVFDARKQPFALDAALARRIADRRRGIGCDQIIVIGEEGADNEAYMTIFNADGSEVEACGNATRCVAKLLMDETGLSQATVFTKAGALHCTAAADGLVTVDMGVPELQWDRIPLARPVDTNEFLLEVDGLDHSVSAVSMANPHCVLFVDNADEAPVAALGPKIETHPMFPRRTNVEFVTVRDRGRLRMRVWERGAGITQACGSGACSVVVAAHRRGLTAEKVEVELDGGILGIEIKRGRVLMTGPTELAYRGEIELA